MSENGGKTTGDGDSAFEGADADEVIEILTTLARLDGEAADAYSVASEMLQDDELGRKLIEFSDEHIHHLRELNRLIRRAGGAGFDEEDLPAEGLLARLAESAAAVGPNELVIALIGNELLCNSTYRTALNLPFDESLHGLIARHHAEEQRHLGWLLRVRERLGVPFPSEPVGSA
jgi:rubrerythrin